SIGTNAKLVRVESSWIRDVAKIQSASTILVHNKVVAEQSTFTVQRGESDSRIAQGLSLTEHLSLHEEYIEVAVIIVVHQRNTPRQHLGVIQSARHPVEIGELQVALDRSVDEPFAGGAVCAACGGARRRTGRARRRI